MLRSTLLLTFFPLAFAAPSLPIQKRDTSPIYDGSQVSGKTYDYVIAGGGLTGVVLAARLSEDSSKTVLVVESGYNEENNRDVTDASRYQSTFDTFLDWAYKTVPQSSANNQPQTVRCGRALGGGTVINGLAWSKPHDFQIDAMESLGNTGLNWQSLQNYMKRVEDFQTPSSQQASAGITSTASCHGSGGPIGVQFDPNASPDNLERLFNDTVKGLGLPYATDLTCGNPAGAAPIANTRISNTRIDAYRGYLFGKSRPNLTILSGANVGKINFSSGSTPRATGLEFKDEKSNTYSVSASREVIMATGSIKTPIILQQSGIGPADVLSAAGVTQRVDLPIGLNLIDQTTTTTDWSFNSARGGGQPITFPRFQDLFSGSDASRMQGLLNNNLAKFAQDSVSAGASNNAAGLQKVLEIQRDWILNKGVGFSENFDYSFGTTLGYDSWYLLPFGRGSVKIQDNQPYNNNFKLDPRYYANEFDRLAQAGTARFTRSVSQASPLRNAITGESVPGGSLSSNANLDQWASWVQNNYRSNWHPIGTAPMMSRNLGGCVDSRNKLYGVTGLRVVDASTLPFQVSSHLMSVLYGLAERAADIIKQDNSGGTSTSSSASASRSTSASASRSASTSSSAPSAGVTGRALHPNGDTSKCVQAEGRADGAAVIITDCSTSANQKWTFTTGGGSTALKLTGSNYCLDAGSNPADGVKMKVWTCYSGIPAQTWTYGNDNYIKLSTQNECLDMTDGVKTNGNVLQTWTCSQNNNQKWTL